MTTQTRKIPIKVRCKQAYHYRLSHKREDRNPKGEHCKKNEIFQVERIYKNWCLLENGYWLPIRMGKEILLIPENFDWYMVNVKPGVSYRYEPRADAKADSDFPKQYELVAIVRQQEEWLQTWDNFWLPLCVNPDGQRRFLFILQRSEEVAYPDRLVVTGSSRPGLNNTYYIERVGKKLQLWMERPVWKTRGRKTKLFRWQAPHTEWVIDDELVNSPTVFACPENSEDVRHPGEARSVWMVFVQSLGDFAPDSDLRITPEWDKDSENDANWEDDVLEEARKQLQAESGDSVAPLPIKKLARGNSWILQGLTRPEKIRRPGSPTATAVPPPPMDRPMDPFRRDDDLQSVISVQPLPLPYRIKEEPDSPKSSVASALSSARPPSESFVRNFPRSNFQQKAWRYLNREVEAMKHRSNKLREIAKRHLAQKESTSLQNNSPAPIFPSQSNGLPQYPQVGQLNSNAKVFSPNGRPSGTNGSAANAPRQETYGVAAPAVNGNSAHVVTKADLRAALNQVPLMNSTSTFTPPHTGTSRRSTNMQSLLDIQFQPTSDANKTNPLNLAKPPQFSPVPQFGPPLLSAANGFAGRPGPIQTQNGEGQRQPEGTSNTLVYATSPTGSAELSPFAKTFTSQGKPTPGPNGVAGERRKGGFPKGPRPQRGKGLGQCYYRGQLCQASAIVDHPDEVYVDTFHKRRVVCHRVPRDSIKLVKTT